MSTKLPVGSAMLGRGYYNRHSHLQRRMALMGVPWFEQAAAEVGLASQAPFVNLADYGCSQGANSLVPIGRAVEALRRQTDRPVAVFNLDRPENDFSTLFRLLTDHPESYTRHPGVYAWAAAGSFYTEVLPAESVDLGWTSATLNWLSRVPCPLASHLWSTWAAESARRAWAQQAAQDWEDFLRARRRELRAGGQMVLVVAAADEAGRCGIENLIERAWWALTSMVEEGLLEEEESERMAVPTYYRSQAELVQPFREGRVSGLAVKQVTTEVCSDPYVKGPPAAYVDYLRFERNIARDIEAVRADRQVVVLWISSR